MKRRWLLKVLPVVATLTLALVVAVPALASDSLALYGTLAVAGDVNIHQFEVIGSGPTSTMTFAYNGITLVDPWLEVSWPGGFAWNDDSGGTLNSFITIGAGAVKDGLYTVKADSCCTGGWAGTYVIHINLNGPGRIVGVGYTPPPGLWLADVCEPYDGFSADGWMTWDSDANRKAYGTQLYAAASADGPWHTVIANGPPYVFNQATMEALADMVGADSYLDMWFRVSGAGGAVHVESAIQDRALRMDDICGW